MYKRRLYYDSIGDSVGDSVATLSLPSAEGNDNVATESPTEPLIEFVRM
jgi:hypothetical protein